MFRSKIIKKVPTLVIGAILKLVQRLVWDWSGPPAVELIQGGGPVVAANRLDRRTGIRLGLGRLGRVWLGQGA